jgi:hypothetical protein
MTLELGPRAAKRRARAKYAGEVAASRAKRGRRLPRSTSRERGAERSAHAAGEREMLLNRFLSITAFKS